MSVRSKVSVLSVLPTENCCTEPKTFVKNMCEKGIRRHDAPDTEAHTSGQNNLYCQSASWSIAALQFRVPHNGISLIHECLFDTQTMLLALQFHDALDLYLIHGRVQPGAFVVYIFDTGTLL